MQKFLIYTALIFLALAFLWPFIVKLKIGRLPGDIFLKKDSFSFYFPITSSIIISIIISFIFWLLKK